MSLADGSVVEGRLRPSTDTETHRSLYLAFPSIGGVTHTHSTHAVAFAQARRPIPVLGTTHADTFNGPVPVTAALTPEQCAKDYEYNTGQVIVDLLERDATRAEEVPGALVAHHGPFTWGADATKSLEHAIICEAVAEMALHTIALGAVEPRSTYWTAISPASTGRARTTATPEPRNPTAWHMPGSRTPCAGPGHRSLHDAECGVGAAGGVRDGARRSWKARATWIVARSGDPVSGRGAPVRSRARRARG